MNPLAYVEAVVAALAVLWLAAGLVANPLVFGAVALFALVPLMLVALPAFAVHAFGDRSLTVRQLRPAGSAAEAVASDGPAAFPSDD
ncbi:MAG: hypothetical protein V5A62_15520 [Haloarculaceae archaeon]